MQSKDLSISKSSNGYYVLNFANCDTPLVFPEKYDDLIEYDIYVHIKKYVLANDKNNIITSNEVMDMAFEVKKEFNKLKKVYQNSNNLRNK